MIMDCLYNCILQQICDPICYCCSGAGYDNGLSVQLYPIYCSRYVTPYVTVAVELAMIMDRLYGGVCYAGIDTDPELKYPKVQKYFIRCTILNKCSIHSTGTEPPLENCIEHDKFFLQNGNNCIINRMFAKVAAMAF